MFPSLLSFSPPPVLLCVFAWDYQARLCARAAGRKELSLSFFYFHVFFPLPSIFLSNPSHSTQSRQAKMQPPAVLFYFISHGTAAIRGSRDWGRWQPAPAALLPLPLSPLCSPAPHPLHSSSSPIRAPNLIWAQLLTACTLMPSSSNNFVSLF